MIVNYLLNFADFTKPFCFNGVVLCVLLPNYFLEFCQIFYDWIKAHLYSLFFWQKPKPCLNVKSWSNIKEEFGFNNFSNFKWQQLIYVLPAFWKKIIKETDPATLLKKHINWYWETKFEAVMISLCAIMLLHQHLRSILSNYLKLTALTGNRYIFYHVRLPLTGILVSFNLKSWGMFFIWRKNFLRFGHRLQFFVISADVLMELCSIYFVNAI